MFPGSCPLIPARVEKTGSADIVRFIGLKWVTSGYNWILFADQSTWYRGLRRARWAGTLTGEGAKTELFQLYQWIRSSSVQKEQRLQHVAVRARAISIPKAGDINQGVGNAEITSWE